MLDLADAVVLKSFICVVEIMKSFVKRQMWQFYAYIFSIFMSKFSEYVNAYIDFLLNKAIYQQFRSFYMGFHSVCASNVLLVNMFL